MPELAPLNTGRDVAFHDTPVKERKTYPDKINSLEKTNRIRTLIEFLLDDRLSVDIQKYCMDKWNITDRQARRYIADARKMLQKETQHNTDHLRRLKINSLQKLKNSLKEIYKGTPRGISAVLHVEKEIAELQNLYPAKKVELTGKDGQPIQTENTIKSDIDYEKLSTGALEEIVNARKTNVKTSGN